MDVLSETVRLIQDRAVVASGAAGKCVLLPVPGLPAHKQYAVHADGTVDLLDIEPVPRAHTLGSLAEAVAFVNAKAGANTVVWFDRHNVIVVLDDETRRDLATLPLVYTDTLSLLMQIAEDGERFDQKDFRRLLRVNLAFARTDDKLLNWVSNAKFNTATSIGGVVTTAKESLGRDINDAALSSAGDLPEEINLDVRIFDDPSLEDTSPIRCAVELFFREAQFTLTPLPEEIRDAVENVVDLIGEKLREAVKVPVFRGSP